MVGLSATTVALRNRLLAAWYDILKEELELADS
jgi:hypothetical protein